ncbi:uncharacterized protein LOC143362261 [Halictus rubicundus]|uniref:uncharacterized protein LOC143362261 n=1 Tax=Halictus rubicundus TaxID=77578 RepID=UPI004037233F
MTERSRTLRSRKNSASSDVLEIPDKHAAIVTAKKRSKNMSNISGVNKSDDQTRKRLTRAGSESKMTPIVTRPTRRTRASSTESEAIMEDNAFEIHNSGLVHSTPVNTRKQRSMLPLEKKEKMIPFVALDRILPNVKEVNETSSKNSTTEKQNKSISISSSESTCIEGTEADVNVKKEHTDITENPFAKTLQENETDMSINKITLSEISEKSKSDSTNTITQMKTATLDVPKTQSRISTEVILRKLQQKNESSTNNSMKEDDEHLSNKENRASNIIEDPQNEDVTVSNILSQSPQPLIVSDVCTENSVKENDEDNTQNLIVTDTESLSETPLSDSIGRSTSCIEVCEDLSLDKSVQILECPENVNNINALSPLNNDHDALPVKIRDDSNQDGGIQIQKCEENIIVTLTDKCFGFDDNKKEQMQHITSEDETTTTDNNDEMRLILEAEETANVDEEESKEVSSTQIAIANAKCEGNNEAGVLNTPENLNDTGVKEYSKLSDMSIDEISTSLMISMDETTTNKLQETEMTTDETTTNDLPETEMTTDETTTNDLQETEMTTDETTTNDLQETEMTTDETTTNDLPEAGMAAKVPSHESITKEPFNVHTQSNNFEPVNENENNITTAIENSHSSNVAQSSEKVDVTHNTSKVDTCLASEEKSIIDSNSQNDIERNEIPETVQKQEEKMQVDDNLSDAHIDTDLFQDISADEWKERNSETNFVHSMSTERLENESENECDDFVLVDKEVSQSAENINIGKGKEAFDYDSDDTVVLKGQSDVLTEKTGTGKIKDTQQSLQQEEIIAVEAKSENKNEHMEKQTEELQNAENVSMRKSITNEVSKQSPLGSDTPIEKPVNKNLKNEIDKNVGLSSTESPSNKRNSKSKLSEDMSNERKSLCKSVEKSDSEVEEPSEADIDSLNKSPIASPSNVSDSNKTDESMDSDIEREYNLQGVEVCKFSDDDVPGDECRASETESSDPDDNGSDLADFVVNDDDEISEEGVDSSEIDEESYNGHDDKHRESDKDPVDEERGEMQMKHESDEKTMKNGKQKKIDRGTFKKEKSKSKKSVKLSLDKITESNKKITNPESGTIDKKRKRNKIKRCVEEQEIDEKELDKEFLKVQIHEEIERKVTKKGQQKRGMEEIVQGIQSKCTDSRKKEKSKLKKTTKLDLSEMSESGKTFKRKSEIETRNKIKKIKAKDNDNTMQKENAIPTWKRYENPTVKSNKMEVSKKRVRNLLEEVGSSSSNITMNKSKRRKLLSSEDLPSCSILDSFIEKSDINVKQDFTSLSVYGSTTNFYVTNIQKLKRRKNSLEVQLFRQRILLKKRRLANYTMFLEKQKALCTHKFITKPFCHKTRGIVSTETVDSPLRRSSRVKSAGKHNESSPESPLSDSSNISNTQSVRNIRRRVDSLNNSVMTERSRTLRSRRNSVVSDAIETPDKTLATPTKRTRNTSNNDGFNKSDDQTSFSKRLTRAGSESKSPTITTRPTRKTRASSMGPETVAENNVVEIHNSGLVHNTPVNTRKRRSMLPLEATVIEEQEEKMIPFVALDRVLPNVKEVNETSSENSTTEKQNKSISISSSESTCIEGTEADVNAKKEHTDITENPSAKTLQENETDMSINKNTLSEISEKSRSDSTDTITQIKTATLDVPKTQSRISTEVILRKLRLKNERSANNSMKEDDEHLSNKENRASNIIEEPQNEDVTVSNILSQSPQPLIVSDVCTEKSVKENDEDAGSSDNTQNLIVTDSESLSETPLNDSIGRSTSCIEVCEDSSLDENIQILKCPENVNNINSVSLLNDTEDQNALPVKIRDDSNQDGGIQIQKCEENINVTHTDKCFGFDDTKKEQMQPITSEDETITTDNNDEMRLILEAEETANVDEEESKEVSSTQIAIANAKCEGNNEAGVLNTPENLNDTSIKDYSKSPDMSIDKLSTSLIISTDETTTNDLQETEMTTDETTTNNLQETEMTTDETTTNDLPETEMAMEETTTKYLQETEIAKDETTTNDLQDTETAKDETTTNDLQETEIAKDETTTNDLIVTETAKNETTTNDLQETEIAKDETTTNDLQETEMTTDETTTNDLQETEMTTDETTTNDLQETEMTTDETTTNDLPEAGMAAKVPSHESITKEPFNVHTQSNNFEPVNENENNITTAIENSHSSNVAQSSEKVDVTHNTSKVDTCLASEEKSIIDSNSQNDIEMNEIPETVQKQEEKMQVDDNLPDAHIDTDLFQDIPADEWQERNSDKNSVHSMSTERLENESENECDDFVLVDKEVSQSAENINIGKGKEAFDYDSDDTVVLKGQRDVLTEKTGTGKIKDTQQSLQQEEIIAVEAKSENKKEHMEKQTEELQNAENVSMRKSITNEVSKQSPLGSDTPIEKPVNKNLKNEIDKNVGLSSTESPSNKRNSKSKLSEDMSNERKSLCKSVEKSDSEVEEPSEADIDSLNKSPIASPSNVSDSNKTDESMDSDIEREYNLQGVEVCKFSDDDVPGDECRASETESSDPDDNGSDLADFVVNDDDEISEEGVDSSEIDEESYNGHDDKHRESDKDPVDEERGEMQMKHESDEKTMKNGKQKKIDRGTFKKEKSKSKKSVKLSLDKITESNKKITNPESGTIDKKRKRNKIKRCVEEQEIDEKELDKEFLKVQIHEEIERKVTKKGQQKRGMEEIVQGIQSKCTDSRKKEKSKLKKTKKLDLSEISESDKNFKRKSEIETGNKIKKIKAKDNDNKMLKDNAVVIRDNRPTECSMIEVSQERVRRLSEEVIKNLSDLPMRVSTKRKLLKPEREKLPSRSIPRSMLKKRKVNVEQDFISLSSYGSTSNFYVADLQKVKKPKKTSEVQLFRQRMLNRNPRQPISHYTMFLEKQTASNKH